MNKVSVVVDHQTISYWKYEVILTLYKKGLLKTIYLTDRSSKNISAQIIDDDKNITILSASSKDKAIKSTDKKSKIELSKVVAESLAKKAMEKKITKIYFDRGLYKYHGRVKTFAETLRKNGLKF